ncbi:peroxisomal membrane anchor protein conserved region-domain-containing protein [Morchella snyderi]|nr:peroxisomal membrane anchor protein conserved region-domain-containing protein [Morchella snyderi]
MREDLITSAVSLLSDPAIAASPLEKRVAFLQSKNLTQEEIDASLLRAQSALVPAGAAPLPPPVGSLYPPGGYFAPQASPYRYAPQQMPSRARDWRDYFILATVTTTASLTLYHLARRYITPLIAPPTPPQLATDKAAIDAEFAKAFTLLDTLRSDTSALKTAEEERKTRVDAALAEVESVIQSLKDAGKRREDESKRVGDEVRGLRDLIPKALEGQKESQKKALEDLGTELKSLKQLVMNRTGAGRPQFVPGGVAGGTPPLDPSAAAAAASAASAVNGAGGSGGQGQALGSGVGGGGALAAAKMGAPLPFGGMGSRPAIPAWQMAAANKAAAAAVASPAPESQGEGASSG